MKLKESLLLLLEQEKGNYVSGQQIAEHFDVSRNAVWKAVQALKNEGHRITSVPNKGYCLEQADDCLTKEGILSYGDIRELYVYDVIDSTNDMAKKLLSEGSSHGTFVVSNQQTAGKGRRGRSFYSPGDTGIYCTTILKLNLDFSDAVMVTTAASVAVCRAIEEVCGVSAGIKWVNDIYINDRKVCGILTEAITNMETGTIDTLICGIGINVSTMEFPEEVGPVASSIFDGEPEAGVRNKLASAVYRHLMQICDGLPDRSYLEEYRRRSIVIGKRIRYTQKDSWKEATAIGVDDAGGLVVIDSLGEQSVLSTGEITVRLHETEDAGEV